MPVTNYLKPVDYPRTRLRFYTRRENGVFVQFAVQLEYDLQAGTLRPDDYTPVARFDHDVRGPHDVRDEGLHMDLLDPGDVTYDVVRGFPPVPLDRCPDFAERYLLEKHDRLVADFERRNGL